MKRKRTERSLALVLLCVGLIWMFACSQEAPPPSAPPPAPSAPATAQPPAETPPAAPAEPAPAPATAAPMTPAADAAKPPIPEPKPAETVQPTAPVASVPEASKPMPVEPPKPAVPAHAAVGSEKCKMCHKTQYDSWAASKHAGASPKTECETCHGNAGDYMKMSIMKNRAEATAAGLILPDKAACTLCHKDGRTDAQFQGVHAHKVK